MSYHTRNGNGSMNNMTNSSNRRVRRTASNTPTTARTRRNRSMRGRNQRNMEMNTGRRYSSNMTTPRAAGRSFIIAHGTGNNKQWLKCASQTVTSDCQDVTDQYNISLYSGNPFKG
tara:strand:- start:991 stop:1338 length:348 start_codon:yes stop_codon:yes gene_type:complete